MDGFVDEMLTTKELAQFLKLSEKTVYKLLRAGQIPYTRLQREYRVFKPELIEWLKANRYTEINY